MSQCVLLTTHIPPEVMGQTVAVWVVETPLTLLASRPTRFHTSILHPLSSHSVCLCLRWAPTCVSITVFYKEK